MIPDGLPLDEGVIGRAVRTCEPQLVVDVSADPDYFTVLHDVASEIALPLISEELGIVGVLDIETRSRLPADSLDVVRPLAVALTSAIDEIREGRTIDLSSLVRLFVHMSTLRDSSVIAGVATRSLGRVLPIETSQLLIADDDGGLVEAARWRAAEEGPEPLNQAALRALRARIDTSAVFELLDTSMMGVPELVGAQARSVVLIPLRANGSEFGLLVGTSRFAKDFDRGQSELAALLAAHTAASLDSAISLARERESAHTDALTGLVNRRGLEELFDREIEGAQHERCALSVAVFDCDDFKDVNDRAGHEFGDALLRELGSVLQSACGSDATPARLGGDEFVVILPGASPDAAAVRTDRLRLAIDAGLADAGFPLHVSAGVSTYPYDGAGVPQLLRAADQALYRAKAGGKNCVVEFRDLARGDTGDRPRLGMVRGRLGADRSALGDAMESSDAIWADESVAGTLDRLGKAVTFVVGGTGAVVSRVEGDRLAEAARHAMRNVDFGDEAAYLIADFPLTQQVLETKTTRSISFLDDDLDQAEAFVLRELQMNSCLLVPLVVAGRSWGLVEVYDMRMRRFTPDDEVLAMFLSGQAGRRIEALGEARPLRSRLPLFRLPPQKVRRSCTTDRRQGAGRGQSG